MSRRELVVEIIYTTILRGFFILLLAFICVIFGIWGRLIAVCIVGLYIYTIIDEVRLFSAAYHEADH